MRPQDEKHHVDWRGAKNTNQRGRLVVIWPQQISPPRRSVGRQGRLCGESTTRKIEAQHDLARSMTPEQLLQILATACDICGRPESCQLDMEDFGLNYKYYHRVWNRGKSPNVAAAQARLGIRGDSIHSSYAGFQPAKPHDYPAPRWPVSGPG